MLLIEPPEHLRGWFGGSCFSQRLIWAHLPPDTVYRMWQQRLVTYTIIGVLILLIVVIIWEKLSGWYRGCLPSLYEACIGRGVLFFWIEHSILGTLYLSSSLVVEFRHDLSHFARPWTGLRIESYSTRDQEFRVGRYARYATWMSGKPQVVASDFSPRAQDPRRSLWRLLHVFRRVVHTIQSQD